MVEGEFKWGEMEMEGEMGTDFSPELPEVPEVLMVRGLAFNSAGSGMTTAMGNSSGASGGADASMETHRFLSSMWGWGWFVARGQAIDEN